MLFRNILTRGIYEKRKNQLTLHVETDDRSNHTIFPPNSTYSEGLKTQLMV